MKMLLIIIYIPSIIRIASHQIQLPIVGFILPETNSPFSKRPSLVFQPSIFRGHICFREDSFMKINIPSSRFLCIKTGLLRESQNGGLAVLLQHEKVGEAEFLRKCLEGNCLERKVLRQSLGFFLKCGYILQPQNAFTIHLDLLKKPQEG